MAQAEVAVAVAAASQATAASAAACANVTKVETAVAAEHSAGIDATEASRELLEQIFSRPSVKTIVVYKYCCNCCYHFCNR